MKRSTATVTSQFEFPFVHGSELGAPHLLTRRMCVPKYPFDPTTNGGHQYNALEINPTAQIDTSQNGYGPSRSPHRPG
jgi:hypothetical protein